MDPATLATLEKLFQYGGMPALILGAGGWFTVKFLIPRLDRHLDILHESLDTQKLRAVSTDEKLSNIENKVDLIHEHIIAPPVRPSWMERQERHQRLNPEPGS